MRRSIPAKDCSKVLTHTAFFFAGTGSDDPGSDDPGSDDPGNADPAE